MSSTLLVSSAACAISFIGVILLIVGIATDEWTVYQDYNGGLWKICAKGVCASHTNKPSELMACEAFGILSVLVGIACCGALVAFVAMIFFKKSFPKILLYVASGTGIAAAICMIITTAIWGDNYYFDSTLFSVKLGYSFVLTVVGGILLLLAAIVSFFVKSE